MIELPAYIFQNHRVVRFLSSKDLILSKKGLRCKNNGFYTYILNNSESGLDIVIKLTDKGAQMPN